GAVVGPPADVRAATTPHGSGVFRLSWITRAPWRSIEGPPLHPLLVVPRHIPALPRFATRPRFQPLRSQVARRRRRCSADRLDPCANTAFESRLEGAMRLLPRSSEWLGRRPKEPPKMGRLKT